MMWYASPLVGQKPAQMIASTVDRYGHRCRCKCRHRCRCRKHGMQRATSTGALRACDNEPREQYRARTTATATKEEVETWSWADGQHAPTPAHHHEAHS